MYDLYEAEAKACIERGLVIPAYDYVLRCSHTFNILDSSISFGAALLVLDALFAHRPGHSPG